MEFPGDWSKEDLETVLFYAIKTSSQPTCIFLDGLDEIDPSDGQFRLLELVDKLCTLPQLKLCVSSRPEPVLQGHFSKFPIIRVQDMTKSDIQK